MSIPPFFCSTWNIEVYMARSIPNLDFLKTELDEARERLANQFELVQRCQAGLASAIDLKLKATEASLRIRLRRLQATHGATQSVVRELEEQIGQLPLKSV